MKRNSRAGQVSHAYPHRLTAVSGAHAIEPLVAIEVADSWLEFEETADSKPSALLENIAREHQQKLERIQLEAEVRITAVERERDAALAILEQLRAELSAITATSRPKPQIETPLLALTSPHAPAPRGGPNAVPTLSEVVVVTEPLETELAQVGADDRRTDPRSQRQFELEFNYETQFFAGISLDISGGGLFIATYQLIPVGTALSLSFQLPDGVRVSVRGEVRWIRCASEGNEPPGMGVAFKELTREAFEAISRFGAERPPLYMEL